MAIITQKSREELRRFIFDWMFDSNRFDKLSRIAIAKKELGFTEGEIGKKLGVSKQRINQDYKTYLKLLKDNEKTT